MNVSALVDRVCDVVRDKQGEDLVSIDLRGHSELADYFIIASASSTIHARAIAEDVEFRLKQEGERVYHVEGMENGRWILLDYVDVVVHILLSDARQFYGLDRLWGDLPQKRFPTDDE